MCLEKLTKSTLAATKVPSLHVKEHQVPMNIVTYVSDSAQYSYNRATVAENLKSYSNLSVVKPISSFTVLQLLTSTINIQSKYFSG